jgi:hypothetical protein
VTTCDGDGASSGIRSWPAWAFPSWQPWSRTGGRPRPWSWSLPRCACASCCTGGGGSRLSPIANKVHCSTRPSTSGRRRTWARHARRIPAPTLEPPITHPRSGPEPQLRTRSLVPSGTQSGAVRIWLRSPPPGGRHHAGRTAVEASDHSCPPAAPQERCRPVAVVLGAHRRPVGFAGWGAFVVDGATPAVGGPLARAQ